VLSMWVTNLLFGKTEPLRRYSCDKHGTIGTVLRFEQDEEAKRYCTECFREMLREVKAVNV